MVHVFVSFHLFASNFSDFGKSSQLLNGQGLPKVPKNSSEKLRISDDWSSLENAKLANFHLRIVRRMSSFSMSSSNGDGSSWWCQGFPRISLPNMPSTCYMVIWLYDLYPYAICLLYVSPMTNLRFQHRPCHGFVRLPQKGGSWASKSPMILQRSKLQWKTMLT